MAGERGRSNFAGDLEADGALNHVIARVAPQGQLVLLHGDQQRLRLLVNLVEQLREHSLFHTLLLSFVVPPAHPTICDRLRSYNRVLCATSSWLTTSGPTQLRASVRARGLSLPYLSWLQRFRYLRLFLERSVDVLALDSDISLRADPYPLLRTAELRTSCLVTTFDYKGGFANTNIGFMSFHNCSRAGPIHALLLDFEQRIARALPLPRTVKWEERKRHASQFLWDQNVWNKALLSALVGRPVYLPDGSDLAWSQPNRKLLRARLYWREAEYPSPLPSRPPWYPPLGRALWSALTHGGVRERITLAPAWLVSMENGIGHKQKHVAYGAAPPHAALLHFTCVAQSENARVWPLRLLGGWHAAAVAAAANETAGAAGGLIALADGSLERPLRHPGVEQLRAVHLMLGGLATLLGRRLVLPAINCSAESDRKIAPGAPSRCFWYIHTPAGERCVFRIGGCDQRHLATPHELSEAIRASPSPPPVTALHFTAGGRGVAAPLQQLLGAEGEQRLVLVDLRLPPLPSRGRGRGLNGMLHRMADAAFPRLGEALRLFSRRCPDVTALPPGQCNNICS